MLGAQNSCNGGAKHRSIQSKEGDVFQGDIERLASGRLIAAYSTYPSIGMVDDAPRTPIASLGRAINQSRETTGGRQEALSNSPVIT